MGHGIGCAHAIAMAAAKPSKTLGVILWAPVCDPYDVLATSKMRIAQKGLSGFYHLKTGCLKRFSRKALKKKLSRLNHMNFEQFLQPEDYTDIFKDEFKDDPFWVSSIVETLMATPSTNWKGPTYVKNDTSSANTPTHMNSSPNILGGHSPAPLHA